VRRNEAPKRNGDAFAFPKDKEWGERARLARQCGTKGASQQNSLMHEVSPAIPYRHNHLIERVQGEGLCRFIAAIDPVDRTPALQGFW
jgi:hypothetical protein